jgi:hypothetical protein
MKAEAQTISGESTIPESSGAESNPVDSIGEAPRPAAVRGLARLATYLCGKEILILGPGNAGKTKFAQYLRLACLDPEGKREMTYAVTRSPAFVVDLGRQEGLVLRVRRAVDTPGQVGPLQHAILVARRKPHAVIVILDCSGDPLATLRWFCLFCNALDSVLRKVPAVARRLQEMVVILNKRDKIADKEYHKLRQAARKVLERFLTVAWGEVRIQAIPIKECISVQSEHGTALIDGVITQLIERLIGRQIPPGAGVGPRLVTISPGGPAAGPAGKPGPASSSGPGPGSSAVGPRLVTVPLPDPSSAPSPAPAAAPATRGLPAGAGAPKEEPKTPERVKTSSASSQGIREIRTGKTEKREASDDQEPVTGKTPFRRRYPLR